MISDKIQKTWQQITGQTIMEMIAKKFLNTTFKYTLKLKNKNRILKINVGCKCKEILLKKYQKSQILT